MPELPDVEGFREVLMTCGRHPCVTDVQVRDAGVLWGVTANRLRGELRGRRLGKAWRHGKWLFVPTDDGPVLAWHFGMSGSLLCCSPDDPVEAHDRVVFTLDDSRSLRCRDQRKLQGLRLAERTAVDRIEAELGPDALAIERDEFLELLSGRRGAVKGALMDQSVIAGLGNLLCDEILWRARVHPRTPARDLSDKTLRRIHTAMRRVLDTAVRDGRVPPRRSWLTGRRDDSDPKCPRCGPPLSSGSVAGRRTVWCPDCQS
ncbi:Fpg/Nei family DNA glycosylase [Streptomyces ipomoeae]|uniref:Putative DNA-formamidopyrimidine glycosylase n=1 Tax=Streptomyces ipomoeae 91-03 TaxID=698759 RepID=L1KGV8_9ACTN|nr:DNA-formamidopyrimidine glycosylase family protein [Streptomyces ipomoeae]EKX60046.1 putative DNA-formamidopyrimidine glycosylase [Streptomyces ipomoeae 91-03]MDX2696789.1 Fpg/Nei family DNA glycosylase [Streptomyces ipomoeae]MDX2837673.1 Fpg/Nei family DNA glycosylase [Streptomyces ipomoeae]